MFANKTKKMWALLPMVVITMMLIASCGGNIQPTPIAPTEADATEDATSAPATGETATVPLSPVILGSTEVTASSSVTSAQQVSQPVPTASAAPATEDVTTGCAIEPNPDLVGYSDLIEKLGCPISEGASDIVGINEFGEGPDYDRFMLWFGSEGQIYVLSPDGRWLAYTDTWAEDEAEISCNPEGLDPATSPPLPRRGFGQLWCTVDTVRTSMGYIDREERLCQHAVVQRFQEGRLLACFEDATIRYFRILEDGAWDLELVR